MKKQVLAAIVASGVLPLTLAGQTISPPAIEWQRSFGGTNFENAVCVRQTSDGGFIVGGVGSPGLGGNKTSPGFGGGDFWILRLDRRGNNIWDRSFGGDRNDVLFDLQQTMDGGFILAGVSDSPVSGSKSSPLFGDEDYWIVRLDADGNKLWDRAYGTTNSEFATSVTQTPDGGFVLAGMANIRFVDSDQWWILRLDASGNQLWDRTFGGRSVDASPLIRPLPGGGFAVAGISASPPSGNKASPLYGSEDYWLMRVDENGNKLWEKSFGGSGHEYLDSFERTADGGFVLGGSSSSPPDGNKTSPLFGQMYGYGDFWIVRVDLDGNKLWEQSFGGSDSEALGQVIQTADGGFIAVGSSASQPSGNKSSPWYGGSFLAGDYWIVRLDSNGTKLWEQSIGGSGGERVQGVVQTSDGGFLLVGTSWGPSDGTKTAPWFGSSDVWVVKLGPDGLSAPPRLQPLRQNTADIGSSGFRLLLEGVSNQNYVVEGSTDQVIWSAFITNRLAGTATELVDLSATNLSQRFYRARPVP